MKRIVVLGGGFAGLWSAAGAARQLEQLGQTEVEITLVNRDPFHSIRVRNYEADLSGVQVPLEDVLQPIGVRLAIGEVNDLDLAQQSLELQTAGGVQTLPYDRLIFALGSQVYRPDLPGLAQHTFDIDTYAGALRLNQHLEQLPKSTPASTIVVVGGGLTGLEAATELPTKLVSLHPGRRFRLVLFDRGRRVGAAMGGSASAIIPGVLAVQGIEVYLGSGVASVDASGVTLESGLRIPASTVIWCGGMQAHPLTRRLGLDLDRQGRIYVDEFMQVRGLPNLFACGDAAVADLDGQHLSLMSCQHARPMGRFAEHNAVCNLLSLPMLPLRIPWYVTVLDLGLWGGLYTEGWEQLVVSSGAEAKKTKLLINRSRIYPPLNHNRADILGAAAPVVQSPPRRFAADPSR